MVRRKQADTKTRRFLEFCQLEKQDALTFFSPITAESNSSANIYTSPNFSK